MTDIDQFETELEEEMEEVSGGASETSRDGREVAREIVEENGIESTDYIEFQALMDSRGFTREETKEHWESLREDDTIPSKNSAEEGVMGRDMSAIAGVEDVEPGEVEEIHLFVIEDCPSCEKVKEQMQEPIEEGALTVQNITEDDDALELAQETGIDRSPVLVVETEDEYVEL